MASTQVGSGPVSLRAVLPKARFTRGGDLQVSKHTSDWRDCAPGDLYVALTTADGDGHEHAREAIARGAVAVLAERLVPVDAPVVLVKDTRTALGRLTQALAGYPCRKMRTIGVTGEREIATAIDAVVAELREAGATVVDVAVPDLDARYRAARGSAPGSLKAAWNGYLARGASAGEKVLTIDDLLASGKLAPVSARRFEGALQSIPTGEQLTSATTKFYAAREEFRKTFEDLMEREYLDAILFPANQARPHTHEGGLERYGSEPGTCEESAATGLPQVTVPAGFIAGRYPAGVSLLGRMWDDKRLLEMAAAYERATHHRRPPTTVKP